MEKNNSREHKLLIIINGRGGVGKDTLCEFAASRWKVRNVSSITPIKEIAAAYGWKGEKTPQARRFLADLKEAFTRYNDLPTHYLLEQYKIFLEGEEQLMFAHIREPEEIKKFKEKAGKSCVTLLVKREGEGPAAWGNAADDQTENYVYDYVYDNSFPLKEAEGDFLIFLEKIMQEQSLTGEKIRTKEV